MIRRRASGWSIGARILAAVVGGYAVTYCMTAMLVGALPMTRGDAVIAAPLMAWIVYVAVVLWCFTARSLMQAVTPLAAIILVALAWHLVLACAG